MNTETYIALFVGAFIAVILAAHGRKFRHEFIVLEGFTGLLYHKGKFAERLDAGRHLRWGLHFTIAMVDLRKSILNVSGQEVLTADNVGLKATLVMRYQITDPVTASHATQHWPTDLHHAAQLALRSVTGAVPVETLLGQRAEIGAQLLAHVQPEAAKIGIAIDAVEVKDVMFPAELKRAFADVLKAKQEGQAALERARGESASLRNLANAARVLDGNPALMNLRVLQSLSGAQAAGSTLVLGMPAGFVPLKNAKSTPSPESGETQG